MNRRWLQNILLMIFGLSLALVIALILRPESPTPQADAPCKPASSELLTYLKQVVIDWRDPCAEFYWRPESTDEFHVLVRLNNFGLHAPPYMLEKPPGVFRILLIGDSFPQGIQVNMEETFPYLLGRLLGERVEVINLSMDAFGTDRELLLYALLGWQFQPDMLLLSVYPGNDVQDNQIDLEARRYGYRLGRPFFTVDETNECLVVASGFAPPPYRNGEGAGGWGCLQLHNSVQLDPTLYPDSPAFEWLTDLQSHQTDAPPENLPERPRIAESDPYTLEYPVELGLYLPEDDHWREAWNITEVLLLQFQGVAGLSSVPFAAVITPDRRAVHEDDWDVTVAQYGALLPELAAADPFAAGARLENFLAQNNIPVLNLNTALRGWAEAHPDGRLYYPGDGHFTLDGHAVTAEAIAAWLRGTGILP